MKYTADPQDYEKEKAAVRKKVYRWNPPVIDFEFLAVRDCYSQAVEKVPEN